MHEEKAGLSLSERQIDALREAGNIGAGNAAIALSQMVNKKVGLSAPKATLLRLSHVPDLLGGAEALVAGVYLNVAGDCSGSIILLLEEDSATRLAGLMVPGDEEVTDELTVLKKSALQETGSILSASYLNALGQLTGLFFKSSVPGFAIDMAGAILDYVLVDMAEGADHVLVVETDFMISGVKVMGHLVLFPDLETLSTVLERLGVPFD